MSSTERTHNTQANGWFLTYFPDFDILGIRGRVFVGCVMFNVWAACLSHVNMIFFSFSSFIFSINLFARLLSTLSQRYISCFIRAMFCVLDVSVYVIVAYVFVVFVILVVIVVADAAVAAPNFLFYFSPKPCHTYKHLHAKCEIIMILFSVLFLLLSLLLSRRSLSLSLLFRRNTRTLIN